MSGFLLLGRNFAISNELEIEKGARAMNTATNKPQNHRYRISLDTWAVALGLLLAVLVRFGALKHVPW